MIDFLTQLTKTNSRCEPHYKYSQYLAEYFCTITNAGFFAVAYYYNDYATLLAGTFSALSHAIPLNVLNKLDILFANNVTLKMLYNYDLLLNYPKVFMAGLVTLTFGGIDHAIRYGFLESLKEYREVFHSGWHLSAAFALYQFNHSYAQAVTVGGLEKKINFSVPELIKCASNGVVPKFLQPYCSAITDAVSGMAEKMYSLSYT